MYVVIGTVTADILITSDAAPSASGDDGFRNSNLVFTEAPIAISMGGNGGNSAYVLAGLGVPTALCGAIGQDLLGDALAAWLHARNVELTGLSRCAEYATSSSTIIITDVENQFVYHHLGATAAADFEAMPKTLFADAEALLVSSFPIMPKLRAGGFAQALHTVHAAGGMTALDIGPAIGTPIDVDEIAPLLPAVDYLLGNVHELSALTGDPVWPDAVKRLLSLGARNVVVKQGSQGALLWTPDEQVSEPAFAVDAGVSVGAGDSFNVGLLYALGQGLPPARALRFANAVAALVMTAPNGVLDAPTLSTVEAFLAAAPDTGDYVHSKK